MAGELIRLDNIHIFVEQMKMAGVQVGPETHQHVDREVETRDAHILSSMQRVYYHFGRRTITIGIAGGWVRSHWVRLIR
ncbi:hypothetical protein J1N35_004991 [Gossypium stocksii]|uniref:Uncharacterized protein n=1 Tax=Gossypium stocksii TaxID=47602 RepID=A0A9D3WD97_9ROSI|nr:hypothetical protein J1N35_004991 [Gossypium stocksii]